MSLTQSLERVYPYAPAWMQSLGLSLYGVAYRHERLAGDFERYVSEFAMRDRWSTSWMRQHVEAEMRRVLIDAITYVPFYRDAWRNAGIRAEMFQTMKLEDLPKLPITPKEALRSAPGSFIAENIASRERLREYQSSGSSGTPVTCSFTAEAHRRFTAAKEARSFRWAGTSIRAPRSMIGGRLVVPTGRARPPFHRYNWAERQVYFSAFHIAPATASSYVAALNRYRPSVLTGYASAHYLLARMMLDQGLSLSYRPDALVLSSERLTAEMKEVLMRAFDTRAYEEYGAVENCVFASECQHGRLHVSTDFGIVEIVDEQGRLVPAGQQGRILCTGLLNPAQPLIRYEIGDLGSWATTPCPCGRNQLPVLGDVLGRLEDVITGPDGRQMVRFHWVFINLPSVIEGQIVQEASDRFRVKVVTTDAFGQAEIAVIRERFATHLGPVRVEVDRVSSIERTRRGKFRAVIKKIAVPHG
jgi:phenylacetate-CoA ligase